jgi:hypothetical protein
MKVPLMTLTLTIPINFLYSNKFFSTSDILLYAHVSISLAAKKIVNYANTDASVISICIPPNTHPIDNA